MYKPILYSIKVITGAIDYAYYYQNIAKNEPPSRWWGLAFSLFLASKISEGNLNFLGWSEALFFFLEANSWHSQTHAPMLFFFLHVSFPQLVKKERRGLKKSELYFSWGLSYNRDDRNLAWYSDTFSALSATPLLQLTALTRLGHRHCSSLFTQKTPLKWNDVNYVSTAFEKD